MNFKVSVFGKWVLLGEHSVLRGAPAIAFPHPTLKLTLEFQAKGEGVKVIPAEFQQGIESILARLLADWKAREIIAASAELSGELILTSEVPVGAGLGSSAALCVAIVEWLSVHFQLNLKLSQKIESATFLEDFFHGKSSGMDVTACAVGEPIAYEKGGKFSRLNLKKIPCFTFHDTGLRANTQECVRQVIESGIQDPVALRWLDEKMAAASRLASEGLHAYSDGQAAEGLKKIARAMNEGHACFEEWGLVPDAAREIKKKLKAQGALAVKLTGAGKGGFCVALWEELPLTLTRSSSRLPSFDRF